MCQSGSRTEKPPSWTPERLFSILVSLPPDFAETLKKLMKAVGMTIEELAQESEISAETIGRMRRCKEECTSSYETLIAVCIGMHLHPMLSEDLMSKAGKQLQKTQKHICYGIILCDHYMGTVAEANAFLKQFGYEPLSKAA